MAAPLGCAQAPAAAAASVPPPVQPAVLPGTPASAAAFPFTPEQLIEKAKQVHATDTGIHDDSVLAPDFRFAFPIIKLSREEYLKTVRGFTFKQGVPNLDSHPYDFRVDPYEPNRVWFTIRTTGTHTGPFKFGRATYEATGATIQGPPECCSYTFNEASHTFWKGEVTSFTGGYVMDNRVGNTDGLGAAFGILAACGVKIPKPNSLQWEIAIKVNQALTAFDRLFNKQ
ncbi:hypothetical protein COHA_007051 [Chlorella ohadii]|uniref:Uncharacterized protein n=1 Tax=Chlorella ohadii TaxID=2649997 RepID=A0AAD5DN15_9CHLO|nr:hypothetical protein COHA_007051 [Chlorella ohadii]